MKAVPPTLSVCIPTHEGRRATLEHGLKALLKQARGGIGPRVEVCISDNASADGTLELVGKLSAGSPVPIRYQRNQVDLGPGQNIVRAMDMATGEYCWLFSSDDALAEGGLERMLQLLDEHPGVGGVSTACEIFDHALEGRVGMPPDRQPPGDQPRVIEGLSAIVGELGSCFIGMSTQVVQRKAWLQAAEMHRASPLIDGLLPHVVLLVGATSIQPQWLWCPEPLVRWRSAAPISGGVGEFMAQILDDLAASLSTHLDSRDPGYRVAIARFARATYAPRSLRNMATLPGQSRRGRGRLARVMIKRLYWLPDLWLGMAPSVLLPGALVKAGRRARRLPRALVRAF